MEIHEGTLHLAGFALAHAAWSVSDLSEGELLCPLALVEDGKERRLLRFEAESQEQAIGNALATLEEAKTEATAWAFVREGTVSTEEGKSDVLVVTVWAQGMKEPLYLSQRFVPVGKGGTFHIIGPLEIINAEGSKEGVRVITDIVREGIFEHPKVASLWPLWETDYAE
jgi:hypothetical protein